MPPEGWRAEQAVAAAPSRGFQGVVWRIHWREVTATDWSLSLWTSGRYHRGLDLFPPERTWPALYTSLAPEIAIWEMVRRSVARNPVYLRNNVLSELEIDLARVLDVADPAALALATTDLTSYDHRICQDLAGAALARGYQGLLVPSAALPGLNLVILPRNLPEPLPINIVRSTELPLDSVAQGRPNDAPGTNR